MTPYYDEDALCGCGYRQSLHHIDHEGGVYCLIAHLRHQLEVASALAAQPTELAWVIETGGNPLLYWNGHHVETGWTEKHQDALRFARFVDAETIRCWLVMKGATMARSVQHGWATKA